MLNLEVIHESGFEEACFANGLSYGKTSDLTFNEFLGVAATPVREHMMKVTEKLSKLDGGHNKSLEFMNLILDITAPRYWWCQFDTYRVGVTRVSESTMHTLEKTLLTQEHFATEIPLSYIDYLNKLRTDGKFDELKSALPEGFMQRRIVSLNYKALRNIVRQRANHRLTEWHEFCQQVLSSIAHPTFIN